MLHQGTSGKAPKPLHVRACTVSRSTVYRAASYWKLKKVTVNALPSCFFFEMINGTHVFDFSPNISFLLRQNSSVFSPLYFLTCNRVLQVLKN